MSPHRRQVRPQTNSPLKWTIQWLLVILLSYSSLIVTLGWPFIFGHPIQAGDVAERDYVAHKKTSIVDVVKTREAQEQARESTVPVFKKDMKAYSASMAKLRSLLDLVKGRFAQPSNEPTVLKVLDENLVSTVADALSKKDYQQWRQQTETAALRFIKSTPLYPDARASWRQIVYEFLPEDMSTDLRNRTASLIAHCMQPNMVLDDEATHQRFESSQIDVKPVTKQVESGTLLITRGDRLTVEDVMMLKDMGNTHAHDLDNLLGIAIALLAAFCLFGVFLFTLEPQFFFSPSAIALMATVSVVTSGIAAAVGREYPQFVPLPAAALVLSVIFGRRVAIVLALIIIIFARVSDLIDGPHLVALTAASCMAFATNITKRKELMLTGVMIGVVQAIGYSIASLIYRPEGPAMPMMLELIRNLLGGLSSSIVAIGSLPFLESMFGILTPFRVAELSEPDQPLLRQLEEKAPGTYQHSLAVANLAEAGAKAIKADVNLVRAGAMYHDIGKMVTPRFFIENQLGDKNPHDEISPEESRAKVLAHVTNGIELARKYGLPRQVKDFVPEHQGTTVMAYFYHKACQRDGFENVKESDYRYPGPKPQCKETAIVMLADVSEAVTHSLREPTTEEVETVMSNVFKARWDDGQFDESGLSEEELEKVKQGFVRVWRTLHHDRLKYPSTTTGKMPVPPSRTSQPS